MMGTLARVLAERNIMTPKERYWADVEGDIENVNHVLKITQIRVKYSLKVDKGKSADVSEAIDYAWEKARLNCPSYFKA